MKKLFSILGSIIFLAILLLPLFHPILTAVAEESQPKLLTVSHNGKKVTADQEIEAGDNDTIQIKATGDFTLKIPKSEGYEIGLLPEEEQQEIKSKSKETDNLSFAVTAAEEDYEIQLEKDMTVYFKLNLLAESATLRGTASFKEVNLPETQINLIHLVKPAATIESSAPQPEETTSSAEENQEANEKLQESQESSSAAEVTTESSEEIKEVVFYKGDKKLDDKSKITVEEGVAFDPSKNITAKSVDGTEEYLVKAEVERDGKKMKLKGNTFVPETEKNYTIQYSALEKETDSPITSLGIGVLVGNGNVDVAIEWVTDITSQKHNQDFTVAQTGNNNVTYKVNVHTSGKTYEAGQLKITLPASQFKFSNDKNLKEALGWHKDNISLNPLGATNQDTFGYEVGADGETLIITNKKQISGTVHESFEISVILHTEGRKYNGRTYPPVKGRQIIEGTYAKLKFDVEDATQTDPAKKNFSTNELKLTLKTQYKQPSIEKRVNTFDPYEDWDAKLYGNRPSNFGQYYWVNYQVISNLTLENSKNLKTLFKDSLAVQKNGAATPVTLNTAQLTNLKFQGYAKGAKDFYTLEDGGLSSYQVSNNAFNWTSLHDRDGEKFYNASNNSTIEFHYVIGFPKSDYSTQDRITNTIEGSYYDKDTNAYYDKNNSSVSTWLKNYQFKYPPGNTTVSAKNFNNVTYNVDPLKANKSERIDKGLVTNVLQSGNDVDMRSAALTFRVNHEDGNTVPFAMEMYDDHTKWKAADSEEVSMGPDDFYFTRVFLGSKTYLGNASKETIQKNGVVLPNLRLEYQDDTSGVWKTHPDLTIEPTIHKNRGVNPDGSTFDEYRWGRLREDGQELNTYFDLGNLGIRAHRFRLMTVDKDGVKAGVLGKVEVNAYADMCIYGVNPNDGKKTQLEKWIEEGKNISTLSFNNFTGFKAEVRFGSNWMVLNPDNDSSNSRFPTDPKEYGNYLERRVAALTVGGTGPTSNILKTGSQKNNTTTKANDVTWHVQWAEGYEAENQGGIIESLFNSGALTVPIRPKVILYDLLPAGHTYQGIQSITYRDEKLDSSQYKVDILNNNYNGSQRQMIRLTIDGDSVKSKSGIMSVTVSDGPTVRGNTVNWVYKSKVTWGDRLLANQNATTTNRNSVTVSLFDDDNKAQEILANGKTRTTVNQELRSSSGLGNAQLGYLPSVGTGNTTIKNNMNTYGSVEIVGETAVKAGLNKYVRGNPEDGFETSDRAKYSSGGTYEYSLDYTAEASGDGNYIENVILFDKIEGVDTPNSQNYTQGWQGKVIGIDLSYAKSLGIDAKAYVSTSPLMPFFAPNSGKDFSDYAGWKELSTVSLNELKGTKSIGIDLRRKTDGQPYHFTGNDYVRVTIKMEMPDKFPTLPKAYNVPTLSASKVTSGITNDAVTQGTYTDFEVFKNPDLTIVKQDLENPSTKLDGVKFELEYPDGTKKEYTTNNLGQIKVTDLEPGKYKLREKSTKFGYELLAGVYEFTVNNDGTVTHPEDTNYWKYSFSENTISLNVYNRKKFILPITGGTGAAISLLLIVAIAVIAGLGWYLKRYRFTA